MTLRVVSDNTIPLDIYNFKDIAGCARRFADQLEQGEHGEPKRIVLIVDTPVGIALNLWGDNVSGLELLGLLEAAKFRAYEANMTDDD